jgi:hypothetical protein
MPAFGTLLFLIFCQNGSRLVVLSGTHELGLFQTKCFSHVNTFVLPTQLCSNALNILIKEITLVLISLDQKNFFFFYVCVQKPQKISSDFFFLLILLKIWTIVTIIICFVGCSVNRFVLIPYGLPTRKMGHNPPRGPSTDWSVLTTANTAEINGLRCLRKHRGAQDNKFLVTHPMTNQCCLASAIVRRAH